METVITILALSVVYFGVKALIALSRDEDGR